MDLTHGGDLLAKEYLERGNEVTCVDCYGTEDEGTHGEMEALGIRCLGEAPDEEFDLLVSPVHCPDRRIGPAKYRRRLTHHQAVGELFSFRGMMFEVTGASGKTTTCHLISHVLDYLGRNVLMMTSRGLTYLGEEVEVLDRGSIAPASVLRVKEVDRRFDTLVLEISLGGTGLADVGIITTMGSNYPIAERTRTAFDGKVQMVESARRFVVVPQEERDLWQRHLRPGAWLTSFGEGGDVQVTTGPLKLGEEAEIVVHTLGGGEFRTTVSGEFLLPSYLLPLGAALSAIRCYGVNMNHAVDAFQGFTGVPGRGEVYREGDTWVIRDRNPGVSGVSLEYNLSNLEDHYGVEEVGLVIEPVSRRVCETLRMEDMEAIVQAHPTVKGAYLLNPGGLESPSFEAIGDASEAIDRHPVVMWVTKEGYQ